MLFLQIINTSIILTQPVRDLKGIKYSINIIENKNKFY